MIQNSYLRLPLNYSFLCKFGKCIYFSHDFFKSFQTNSQLLEDEGRSILTIIKLDISNVYLLDDLWGTYPNKCPQEFG